MKDFKEVLEFVGIMILFFSLPILIMNLSRFIPDENAEKTHIESMSKLNQADSLLDISIKRAEYRNRQLDSILAEYNKNLEVLKHK